MPEDYFKKPAPWIILVLAWGVIMGIFAVPWNIIFPQQSLEEYQNDQLMLQKELQIYNILGGLGAHGIGEFGNWLEVESEVDSEGNITCFAILYDTLDEALPTLVNTYNGNPEVETITESELRYALGEGMSATIGYASEENSQRIIAFIHWMNNTPYTVDSDGAHNYSGESTNLRFILFRDTIPDCYYPWEINQGGSQEYAQDALGDNNA